MKQTSEIETSLIRVASLMMQHCVRYRLRSSEQEGLSQPLLLAAVADALDLFEERLDRGMVAPSSQPGAAVSPGSPRQMTKSARNSFFENKR